MIYKKLAISNANNLVYGAAPKPLKTKHGMIIGGGTVYPELNFTLPAILITPETINGIYQQYRQIITGAMHRAVELEVPGMVVEFETLPPMTINPKWGIDIAKILLEEMENFHAKHGLKSVLRMTPNDTREMVRPPVMRSGIYWDTMIQTFEGSAAAGAELLSIESVGGKEIHDDALINCDISAVIFALCIMGVRDMRFLWTNLQKIADKYNVHCAGDTACGFGNTAMVLADKKMIPNVFAAVVRAITAVRSLVAYECGAVGPGKDCGYENPILKAITGYPMAMEGKSAACAHLSCLGNISAAACDTWSNESVQNIKLLADMAPTCFMEQLAYDCRLLNQAASEGQKSRHTLQKWLVDSDAGLNPQAYILKPQCCIDIANAIVKSENHYSAGKAAALTAVSLFRVANQNGELKLNEREKPWLDIIEANVKSLPDSENAFIKQMMPLVDKTKFVAKDYELE